MYFGLNIESDKLKEWSLNLLFYFNVEFSTLSAFKSSQIGRRNVHKKSNMLCKIMS